MAEIQKKGIKETQEVLAVMPMFFAFIKKRMADGAGFDDAYAAAIEIMKEPYQKAYENANEIPAELADLDREEYRQLSHNGVDLIFDSINAFTEEQE